MVKTGYKIRRIRLFLAAVCVLLSAASVRVSAAEQSESGSSEQPGSSENQAGAETASKFIFIGDSYMECSAEPWPALLKESLNLTEGVNCITKGKSGAGFAKKTNSFIAQLEKVGSDDSATDILVAGGIGNDNGYKVSESDIAQAMTEFNNYAYGYLDDGVTRRFPSLQRIEYAGIDWGVSEARTSMCRSRAEIYKNTAQSLGWICMNASQDALRNYSNFFYFSRDDVHPTQAGQYLIANAMITDLKSLGLADMSAPVFTVPEPPASTPAAKKKAVTYTKKKILLARMKSVTKNSVSLKWNKISGTSYYVIRGAVCGSSMKRLRKVKAGTASYTHKKLKAGTYYKYTVTAYASNGKALATSKLIHISTKGGKVTNYKVLKLNKTTKKLKAGKTFALKTVLKKSEAEKRVSKHVSVRYVSDTPKVAKVSSKGKITAVAKGTCCIYAIAQDGVYAKIKVTVY